ncbi:speckle-type POZ protein-like [Cotesia typhae]|uniref:speckle-type POZ protein-like n=1 Tax=Cotesia typhae TaxID=2053667 RepID=UPI003D686767
MSLCLQSLRNDLKIKTKFTLYILNSKKEVTNDNVLYMEFENDEIAYGLPQFVRKKDLVDPKKRLVSHNSLTVGVELIVYDNTDYNSSDTTNALIIKPNNQLVQDYKQLLDSKAGSDVTLIAGDRKFKAHKSILIARSPAFSKMFSENQTQVLKVPIMIHDIEPEIFEKVLESIYTDEVSDLDEHAEDLLEAADKLQLQSLKQMCEHSLSKTLRVDNAIVALSLAVQYNAKELIDYVADFIVSNAEQIVTTPEYSMMVEIQPELMSILFKKFVDLKKSIL